MYTLFGPLLTGLHEFEPILFRLCILQPRLKIGTPLNYHATVIVCKWYLLRMVRHAKDHCTFTLRSLFHLHFIVKCQYSEMQLVSYDFVLNIFYHLHVSVENLKEKNHKKIFCNNTLVLLFCSFIKFIISVYWMNWSAF